MSIVRTCVIYRVHCRKLCPYAPMMALLMNISPVQKKITRVAKCTGCRDAVACPQGIDVVREICHDGKVIKTECIECYACIDACDDNVLKDVAARLFPRPISSSPMRKSVAAGSGSQRRASGQCQAQAVLSRRTRGRLHVHHRCTRLWRYHISVRGILVLSRRHFIVHRRSGMYVIRKTCSTNL